MRLSTTLRIVLGVMLVLIVVQAVLTRHYGTTNLNLIQSTVDRDFVTSLHMAHIAVSANKMRRYEKEYFIYTDSPSKLSKYKSEWEAAYLDLKADVTAMRDNQDGRWTEEDRDVAAEWDQALEAYAEAFRGVMLDVETRRITSTLAANDAIRDGKNKFRILLAGAEAGGERKYKNALNNLRTIERNNDTALLSVGGSAVLTLGFALGLFLIMPTAIGNSIDRLCQAALRLSKGDLNEPLREEGTARDFAPLVQTLERMRMSQKVMLDRMRRR